MGKRSQEGRQRTELAPTRESLLEGLRDLTNRDAWQEFFDIYWKLLYCAAVKAGLSDREAEDVVQETMLSVARGMGTFKYDPKICSFKGWLMLLTRHRIIDHVRRRRVRPDLLVPLQADTETCQEELQVADPCAEMAFERIWNEEWDKNLVDAALERVKRSVQPKHYQIFFLHGVKNLPAKKVAEALKVTTAQVYVVYHRVARQVQEEVRRLTRAGADLAQRQHPQPATAQQAP